MNENESIDKITETLKNTHISKNTDGTNKNEKPTIDELIKKFDENNISNNKIENNSKDKGLCGKIIEKELGIKNNSDLCDGKDGDVKQFTEGQTICITMLKHCLNEIIIEKVSFNNSNVGKKTLNVMYVPIDKNKNIIGRILYNKELYPSHYEKLEQDYNDICEFIINKFENKEKIRTFSGSNKLLQIRTKGPGKNKDKPIIFKDRTLSDSGYAFYFRSSHGKEVIKNIREQTNSL